MNELETREERSDANQAITRSLIGSQTPPDVREQTGRGEKTPRYAVQLHEEDGGETHRGDGGGGVGDEVARGMTHVAGAVWGDGAR